MSDIILSIQPTKQLTKVSAGFYPAGIVLPKLPPVKCPACALQFTAPALPGLSEREGELFSVCREKGLSEAAIEVVSKSISNPREIPKVPLLQDDFQIVSLAVREIMGLDEFFPVMAQARVKALQFRKPKQQGPRMLYDSIDDDLFLYGSELADQFQGLAFTGCELIATNHLGGCDTYFEMFVSGSAALHSKEDEVSSYLFERYGDEDDSDAYLRCRTCGRFPRRPSLEDSKLRLRPSSDIFRVNDFGGIYITGSASERLSPLLREFLNFVVAA